MKISQQLYRCIPLFVTCARIIPLSVMERGGQFLGAVFACLPIRDIHRCKEHLRRAYPAADNNWINKTCSRCFQHFFSMALMTLRMLQMDTRRMSRHVALEGAENARACAIDCQQGKGTVLMSGHFGHWELQSHFVSLIAPISVIGRRFDNPQLDAFVSETLRKKNPNTGVIYQDQGLLPCIRILRQGHIIAMVPDQDLPKIPGLFSTWYDIPAYTPIGPASLARSQQVAVQPSFLYYRQGRFVLHWGPRTIFERTDDKDADLQRITDYCVSYQEQLVRRFPWQWAWWHRRWRTTPESLAQATHNKMKE